MFEPYNPHPKRRVFEVEIRDATNSDIASIVNICIEREPGDLATVTSNINSYLINKHESFVRLAIVDGQIAGFGKAKYFQGEKITYPGWYLAGLIVVPAYRNGRVGTVLTIDRLDKLKSVASEAYFFANATNRVSIELHRKLSFKLERDHFEFPGVSFGESHGQLYRIKLC